MSVTSQKSNFHVVYLGESSFPFGLAAIQKMILVSKALIKADAKVTIINRKGKFNSLQKIDLNSRGKFEGIDYIYTSGTIYRKNGFISRNWEKLKSPFQEFNYLKSLKKNNDLHAGIVSCRSFRQVFLYHLFGKMLRFPVVINYVEMASVMEHHQGLVAKINDYLIDYWLIKRMDAALPISEVLAKNFQKIAPGKSQFKIPVLCDFEKFNIPKSEEAEPYFLYCGSLSYKEVLAFILEAFDKLPQQGSDFKLYLVVGGNKDQHLKLLSDIKKLKKASKIKVFLNMPHDSNLVQLYVDAKAMLIPLRPTLQDAARFPHKIGEYVATGNPMIATNYGEVAQYFKDGENALIAGNYDIDEFVAKMRFVLEHPLEAKKIGIKGKELGLKEFNYINYGQKLKVFLQGLYYGMKK